MTAPSERPTVRFTVNGRPVEQVVEARRALSDFLRDDLGLTGTHVGCEHGVCGACTVLINGEPARSCIAFAVAWILQGFISRPILRLAAAARTVTTEKSYAIQVERSSKSEFVFQRQIPAHRRFALVTRRLRAARCRARK